MISLKKAYEVSLAKSDFKNQTQFCELSGIAPSSLQAMKRESKDCRWGTIVKVANKLGFTVQDFLANGVK